MEEKKKNVIIEAIRGNLVPIIFAVLCFLSYKISGQTLSFVLTEAVARVGRNAILILSLILPVICGMGLNFSIVLGAMAGEVGLIVITTSNIDGFPGILVALLIGTVVAIVLGFLTGKLFNKVKGQEMITGMILGFFAVGVYDLIFMFFVGTIIPMNDPEIMLEGTNAAGETVYVGLRNTIELHSATKYAIDNLWKMMFVKLLPYLIIGFLAAAILLMLFRVKKQGLTVKAALRKSLVFYILSAAFLVLYILIKTVKSVYAAFFILQIPIGTAIFIILVCLLVVFLMKTKLGRDIRTCGQDMNVAMASGIDVDKTRILATMISTVIAAWGQVVFLQNIGNIQTYNSHEQVGTYAVAAILVGGASTDKATIGQVFTGAVLFHILFFMTPLAATKIFNDSQMGEFFRVFLCYGIIAISLMLYALKKHREFLRRLEEERLKAKERAA